MFTLRSWLLIFVGSTIFVDALLIFWLDRLLLERSFVVSAKSLSHLHLFIFTALLLFLLFVLLGWMVQKITAPVLRLAGLAQKITKDPIEQISFSAEKSLLQPFEVNCLETALEKMTLGLKERDHIRSVLNRAVSEQVAQEMLKQNVELGGELRAVTMLFADIRGFTQICEQLRPDRVVLLLNECMTRLSKVVEENQGVVVTFIGDEIFAIFGAPLPMQKSTLHAVRAAQGMLVAMREWNLEREKEGLDSVEIGIGVNHGVVIAGSMGAKDRASYTVVGSNVNIAARLCSLAGKGEILITDTIRLQEGVADEFSFEAKEPVTLKGMSAPSTIFKVFVQ